ncbi:hypothetical protein OF83DRAFT_1124470 [Amylostereum chailletii]|nr:hypothetical protein OF83DRAFT_1124470 [Amylostereum chailletii]
MSSRKRKLRSSYQEGSRSPRTRRRDEASDELEQPWGEGQEELEYDPALRVIAHEADIVRGPRATYSADALEVEASGRVGDGLIRLGWNVEGEGVVWVDRCVSVLWF